MNPKKQAQILRKQGMTIEEISDSLHAPVQSVSNWVQDVGFLDQGFGDLEKQFAAGKVSSVNARARRRAYQEEGKLKARQNRPLHLAGCMLYWGEGAKNRNSLCLINSDPNMVVLFTRFLREELNVKDTEITLRIQCHTIDENEIQAIEEFWLFLLKLPRSVLRKTVIKKGNDLLPHKVHKNGFCMVGVHQTKLVQHIFGAIQEYVGFEDVEWLF